MTLEQVLLKYQARDLSPYSTAIYQLKNVLQVWANTCYVDILISGSRAKGTAISLASDIDYLVSLTSNCNENCGGLESIYESLYDKLKNSFNGVRKQNVSVRLNLNGLMVDVTPARKQTGNTNDHWLYVSKLNTRKQTNIQRHINDVSGSGRTNEIKLLKIWRELNGLEFSSIYLEYLVINNILRNYPTDPAKLGSNVWHALNELAKSTDNPLNVQLIDPANSGNILSDLVTLVEKNNIISSAKEAVQKSDWNQIFW